MDKSTPHALGKYIMVRLTLTLLACDSHTVCINNNLIYLFGGADLEQRTNELYSFDPCKCKHSIA